MSYRHRDEQSSDSECMYHCPYPGCNYETNRSAHLKRHERTHTKERPYKCPFCDYCASRSDHLRRHYKVHGKAVCALATSRARSVSRNLCVVKVPTAGPTIKRMVPVTVPNTYYQTADEGTMLFLQFIQKVRNDSLNHL